MDLVSGAHETRQSLDIMSFPVNERSWIIRAIGWGANL
jgi:hypothetical protein